MAVILVLTCGVLGFVSAIASLLFFDANLLQALGVWTATGLCGSLMGLTSSLLPRSGATHTPLTEGA